MGTLLNVQVLKNGQMVGQHQFDSEAQRTIKIGRLSSAQVKLEDPKVSRIHAVIEFAGDEPSLIDMGSTVGTLVNGAKVHKVKLNHGDQVVIGATTLVVGVGAPAAAAGAPAVAPGAAVPGMQPGMQAGMPGQPMMGMPGMGVPGSGVHPMGGMPGTFGMPMQGQQAFGQAPRAQPSGMPGSSPGMAPAMGGMQAGPGMTPGAFGAAPGLVQQGMAPPAAAAAPMGPPAGGPSQPSFDAGPAAAVGAPARRITQDHLRSSAVESRPHPALPPEEPMSVENRVLEMRVYWGEVLLAMHHYRKPKRITIGETKRTDVFISSEGLPSEEFPLIRTIDDEYVLTICREMEGELEIGGDLKSLEEARSSAWVRRDDELQESHQVRMPMDARSILHWGGATFAMRFVAPTKPVPTNFFENLDLHYVNTFVFSVFVHMAALITMMVYPYDAESLRVDLFDKPDRFASLILEAPKETKSTKDMLAKIKKTVEEKKEKLQPPKEKPKNVLEVKTNVPKNVKPQKTQEQRKQEVAQKFSKLFTGSSGGGGSLLGGGGGGSLAGTLSNVIGTAGAGSSTAGLAGLGIRGSGPLTGGGVGTSRGIAGIGTSGRLGGGGMAYGSGVGIGDKKDRNIISLSTPVVMGALPADVIKKVINQNKNQIRYCYEVELQRNQNLAGRVMMRWVIGATGDVVKVTVKESTVNNGNVENCLADKIRGWKFPPPAGGGIVEVNYPFVFKAS